MGRSVPGSLRIGIGLTLAALAWAGFVLGLRVSHAGVQVEPSEEVPLQVTVFAIVATPGSKAVDSKLVSIKDQLNRLLPRHGYKLLDAQSRRIVAGESVACDLGHGSKAETWLVRPSDENGKVQFRCELFRDEVLQFSAKVRVPLNQLFFCERPFHDDGSKLLIGIGAR